MISYSRHTPSKRVTLSAFITIIIVAVLTGGFARSSTVAHDRKLFRSSAGWTARAKNGQALLSDNNETTTDPVQQWSARLEKDPVSSRQCDAIPTWEVQDRADSAALTSTSDPVVFHYHNGKVITDEYKSFNVGDEFCSMIFTPQNPRNDSSQFQNLPISGWGPDSIHAEIRSNDIRLELVHPDYWGASSVFPSSTADASQPAVVVAVYSIPYTLNHPGSYQINGEVEFQNYDWVMGDPIDLTKERLPYVMLNNTLSPRSPSIVITGLPVSRPTVKCHYNNNNDLHGRWYLASSFSSSGNQTALNPEAHLEFAEHNTTTDEWGWTFAPDACSLTYFTPEDQLSCLSSRTVQILGDSNSRRVIKSIIGGGIAWCQDPREQICQCEDHFETSFHDALFSDIDASRFRDVDSRADPTRFGRNSSLYFDFVGGLLNPKLFNPWQIFYDSSPTSPSIISQRQLHHGPIDLVHVSFIGWDMASIVSPASVLAALPEFRDRLYAAYPPGTRFVHRLANNMCCGNQNHKTRYSAPRFAIWNAMWRSFWAADEAAGVVRVVDPSVLQGRRDAETAFFCPTTHLRASHVRLEQMMWMGAVCEKVEGGGGGGKGGEEGGGARMRSWGKKEVPMNELPAPF